MVSGKSRVGRTAVASARRDHAKHQRADALRRAGARSPTDTAPTGRLSLFSLLFSLLEYRPLNCREAALHCAEGTLHCDHGSLFVASFACSSLRRVRRIATLRVAMICYNINIMRKKTRKIKVGNVEIGGDAPISVQTMCNTDTRDVKSSTEQILSAMRLGCDIVRLAVPDMEAAEALAQIKKNVGAVPLVADIHFDWRLAIVSLKSGVDALRINPGNIGSVEHVREVVKAANERSVPIRVGVNGGSLEKEILAKYGSSTPKALVESALGHVKILEDEGCNAIKISVKASDVPRTLAAYRLLSSKTEWPLHLGVTEAGTFLAGTIRSSVAMGQLLSEGIGDTIRVSLTDTPEQEVRVGVELLRALSLRAPGAHVTSCPTCGRTRVDVVGTARKVEDALEIYYRDNPAAPRPHIAVMGCVVNGPGEAREADIAIAGGEGKFALFLHGKQLAVIPEAEAVKAILDLVKQY